MIADGQLKINDPLYVILVLLEMKSCIKHHHSSMYSSDPYFGQLFVLGIVTVYTQFTTFGRGLSISSDIFTRAINLLTLLNIIVNSRLRL